MSHPSPRQWFGLLCGVLNWIVSPSIALSLGAWSPPSTRIKKNVNTPHNEHAHKNILGTGARQPNSGNGLSDDLATMWSRTSICRARMGNLCGLHPPGS